MTDESISELADGSPLQSTDNFVIERGATDNYRIPASSVAAYVGSGTVTSVDVDSTTLNVSGGPITSSGSITVDAPQAIDTNADVSFNSVGATTSVSTPFLENSSGDLRVSSSTGYVGYGGASVNSYNHEFFGTMYGDSSFTLGGGISASNLSGTNTGDQTITLTSDVTGSGTGSFATTIANNAVSNAKFRQSAALSVVGRSANSTGNVADIAGTSNQVLVVNSAGNSLAFGQVNLASSSAVTGDLPFSNLAQGSALSVLGVSGNATADVASIAAASDGNVLRRSGTTVGFGAIALGSGNAVTGALSGTNGGSGNSTWGGANRIPYATGTSALTNSANLTFNGTTFTVTGNESITRTTSTANESNPTTSTITQTNSAADTNASITRYNQRLITTDTGTYNNNSGTIQVLNLSSELTSSGATQGTTHTKAVTAGYFSASLTGTVTSGTSNRFVYGIQGYAIGNTNGSSSAYGVVGDATGADTNWAGYFANGNVYVANNLGVGVTSPSYGIDCSGKIRGQTGIITPNASGTGMSVDGEVDTGTATGDPALFFRTGGSNYYVLGTPG